MSDEGQIKSIIERVQRLQEEKRTIEDDIKEVYSEARANGYDVKVLRAVVKHLGKDQDEVAEFDAIFDLYLQSFLAADKPSRAHVARDAGARTREERSKDRLSEAMADNKELSAEMLRDGLISPEAHAENVALSDAVAAKLGSGVVPEKPSGAGTGSAVRTGAPVSETADPDSQPSVQNEAEAGASPEQGSAARADREGDVIASAHADQFVTPTGEGQGRPGDVPSEPASSPAVDAPIKGLAAANAIAARAAQPAEPKASRAEVDIEIPAFLRRTSGGNHPSFGDQA